MMISVWRYSHFLLAVSSFVFLTLAAVSGIVLSAEPVMEKVQAYKADGFERVTLAQSVPVLRQQYPGLQEIGVDDNDYVTVTYTGADGAIDKAYVHPLTGERLGKPAAKKPLFEWMTTLHRSLFLHETGRVIMGVTAFLLVLIALSGIALVLQRQKSIKAFFAPVERNGAAAYYHLVFGRVALFFILSLALTAAYLSMVRFVIKPAKVSLVVDEENIRDTPERKPADFPFFQQTKLAEAERVLLPFSDFPEDYFTVKLKSGEYAVNQFTGDILAQQAYPATQQLAAFSLRWHTGRSGIVWALVLAVTCGYILFFIGSGFIITWKRRSSRVANRYSANECSTVILVGSENGSTWQFAAAVYRQLVKHGEKVYIADMNAYTVFAGMKQLVIMTSTYGTGEPPANARKFAALLAAQPQQQPVSFSVVGFGSRAYPQFCGFAETVDALLQQQPWAASLLKAVMVDDKSPQDFSAWLTGYAQVTGQALVMPRELVSASVKGLRALKVIYKTLPDSNDTFCIRLQGRHARKVVSGDLLAVYPKQDHRERLYSIGKAGRSIQLVVKVHPHGLGSGYLQALQTGDTIKARIVKNAHFHFPENNKPVIMIANGTGIAPFLGMIDENLKQAECYLYCGFRTQAAFQSYQPFLTERIAAGQLNQYGLALSREGNKEYVSELLRKDGLLVSQVLVAGGTLMICGSLAMQKDVMAVLDTLPAVAGISDMDVYKANWQIMTDCY